MRNRRSKQSSPRLGVLALFVWAAIVGMTSSPALSQSSSSARGIEIEPVLSSERGSFRALLIGVNDYEQLNDLQFSEADATALRDKLMAMPFGASVQCLTTGAAAADERPTYRNINERLDAMLKGLDEDSVVIIAFSGHGASFPRPNAKDAKDSESFFCPMDARLADPYHTMISRKSVYDRLEKCPARFKLLLIDACRDHQVAPPGEKTAFDEEANAKGFAKSLSDPAALPKAAVQVVSCMSGERSYEDPGLKHGIFMNYVLEALSGKADTTFRGDRNGRVSYREFKDYVYRATSDRAWAKYSKAQTPQFYEHSELSDFDVVRVTPSLDTHIDDPATVPVLPPLVMPPQEALPIPVAWPFDAAEAKRRQEAAARAIGQPVELTSSIGMKLRLIPPGKFSMGDSGSAHSFPSAAPVHQVQITKPFYVGAYEVTQAQYQKIMGHNPSKFPNASLPVEQVLWDEATSFCQKVSKLEGCTYRLPTEAEWEYACRAGTDTMFHFGNELNGEQANCDGRRPFGTEADGPFPQSTVPGGTYAPNAFGLYDMHGNVSEWCSDFESEYSGSGSKPAQDPTGPAFGKYHILRGGGWSTRPRSCYSACRSSQNYCLGAASRIDFIGFRVVREVSARSKSAASPQNGPRSKSITFTDQMEALGKVPGN